MHQSRTIVFVNYLQILQENHAQYMLKKEFSPFRYLNFFSPVIVGSTDPTDTIIKIVSIMLLQNNIIEAFYDKTLW